MLPLHQKRKSVVLLCVGYLNGSEEFEEMSLEASRSSVMFEVIEREKSIGDASVESMMNHLRAVDKHYNKQLLKKVTRWAGRICYEKYELLTED